MRASSRFLALAAPVAMLLLVCGFAPDSAKMPDADLIVTSARVYQPLAALRGEERFPAGAQLLLVHAGKAEKLVRGFAATADANISFDGKSVLFAGKQAPSDPWQIWEFLLGDHSLRRLIANSADAIRPFYLPAGRLVYAQRTPDGFQLEVAGRADSEVLTPVDANAGSFVTPLSYVPSNAVPADVLADGRILFEATSPLGSGTTPELFLVYTDGSGVESVRCDHGAARWGGRQLASGDVVFTHGTSLARFTSPSAHEIQVSTPRGNYSGAIAETDSGDWLVSTRASASEHYALKLWKPGTAAMQSVLVVNGEDIVGPVVVAPRTRPHHHPSALHDWNYGNLLALDARASRLGDLRKAPATVQLETLDAQGRAVVTGTAPVEADGSFFVQAPADKPIRFTLLSDTGSVVRKEQGWFWLRSGEQRICVGCHTGPERGSENRVPAVLLRTTTPVDLTGAKALPRSVKGSE
jgi:Hydrazine synthase alpha subunit middle domain